LEQILRPIYGTLRPAANVPRIYIFQCTFIPHNIVRRRHNQRTKQLLSLRALHHWKIHCANAMVSRTKGQYDLFCSDIRHVCCAIPCGRQALTLDEHPPPFIGATSWSGGLTEKFTFLLTNPLYIVTEFLI
jgi:hypothetical protein